MYVSLEPCTHRGRGGPCADAIIAASVTCVVAAMVDPDPRVGGRGLERLPLAGVDVLSGLLANEAERAHAGHLRRVRDGRPHVVLKLAVSADDAIGRVGEAQVPVTGEIARHHVQALRSRFDGILVGRGTVEADDPELTVRLQGLEGRSPVRVILDSNGTLASNCRVLTSTGPCWIFSSEKSRSEESISQVKGVRRFAVPLSGNGLDLNACLGQLAGEGITWLLVEGGARIARSFLEADLVDEVVLFRSPKTLGGKVIPALAGLPLSLIEGSKCFQRIENRRFGADMMSRYERVR